MNGDFMRLLVQRLEGFEWVDAKLAECTFPDAFEGVDGKATGPGLCRGDQDAKEVLS